MVSHVLIGSPGEPPAGRKRLCRLCLREVWLTASSRRWQGMPVWCIECASGLDEIGETVRLSPFETLLTLPDPSVRRHKRQNRWPWQRV